MLRCYIRIFLVDNVSTLLDAGHSVVAEMTRSHIQEGIDAAKRVGRPPFGYTVEDGSLQQVPAEYVRVQSLIREVRKSREEKATAAFFKIPGSKIRSTITRSEANYNIPFDNDQWQLERAKVDVGEKNFPPLDVRGVHPVESKRNPE